ncbi:MULTISPECIES: glutathione S-transferase family protein [Shewanella]|uniref:Glutathione S-transferase family protein n=1 Tax=Shewanella psychromarinicola TaxID=2487742 RepID=A0A3N4E1G8_9GAMM|nr:glutathione S-transferase family protein [Shewanella psychromarinicola]AZG35953.1 glutathione S-transferase family protein [Shewanella psychromarinicola]MCL1082871.1 glutathione S-transferase family protein [Shewanella psychromarinicola]RPA23514.1 glutathione S-transferase family protein [Shewanella psychromarinicola]
MGLLQNGHWVDQWYATEENNGDFVRKNAQLRHWVTANGQAGPSGDAGFKAEANRYHLYVSLACPWAHRTLIFRQLKQLQALIDVTVVEPHMRENGWEFANANGSRIGRHITGAQADPLYQKDFLYQLYQFAKPQYNGRVTVPLLWDKKTNTIVSNESSEIIRMFNSAFNHLTGNDLDYYPQALQQQIDELNNFIYDKINNGVYRSGFATSQAAYEEAFSALFSALDTIESRLTGTRYLLGEHITEADWRLFTTLIRFDSVYVGHFKTNRNTIESMPNISAYLRDLYQQPGIAATVNMTHIKQHYYFSHQHINPTQIVPIGPDIDYLRPHNRADLTT